MLRTPLKRPALGQIAYLGTLYDARSDEFLSHSVLKGALPPEVVKINHINTKNISTGLSEDLKDRFSTLGVGPELAASFLAGLIPVSGSGCFLNMPEPDTSLRAQRALDYTITTAKDNIDFTVGNFSQHLDFRGLQNGAGATHVVTEITWGARRIIAATFTIASKDKREEGELTLEGAFVKLKNANKFEPSNPYARAGLRNLDGLCQVATFNDVAEHDEAPPTDLADVHEYLSMFPSLVARTNGGKGRPLVYTMIPISVFSIFFSTGVPADIHVGQLSLECYEKYIDLLDQFRGALGSLNDYYRHLNKSRPYVRADHILDVADKIDAASRAESELRSKYTALLKVVRAGSSSCQDIAQLIHEFVSGVFAPRALEAVLSEYSAKLAFISFITSKGAKYLGPNASSVEDTLCQSPHDGAYVLFFNNTAISATGSWDDNVRFLFDILQNEERKEDVLIVDCDGNEKRKVEESYVSYFRDGVPLTEDVLKYQKQLAGKWLMRYEPESLDTGVDTIPMERKPVSISCPGYACGHEKQEWACFECRMVVEYAPSDEHMYCDCGRVHYSKYEFHCRKDTHGSEYTRHETRALWDLLNGLPSAPEVNILILGESGVGKSTFINAFINYLTFPTLDEALTAKRLNWIIPCSFATQTVDEITGRIIQTKVKVGHDNDEKDGVKGQSATQKATTYPLYIGGKLVRLIDTPGIGDVRGIEKDKENMVNVLSVLRNYEKLHGILILLKPNNARLGVMFRFCVKELLTHLHRDAAENVVYGFTNTRSSNYRPGDTYGPLATLLSEYKGIVPDLYHDTVYCYDSESFRYLAARSEGVDIGNIEDYRRSWDHSAKESRRLMNYFERRAPHNTKATISLNETRYLIAQLVGPMSKISSAINDSVARSKKQIDELSDTRLTGAALMKKLHILKTVVEGKKLTRPKTVCADESCVSHRKLPNGGDIVLRKSLCHDPCCLTNVPPDSVGTPKLIGCAAFHDGECTNCHHSWDSHEHIMVEYTERTEQSTDPEVIRAINENGNEIRAKQAQIKALEKHIAELEAEHSQVQETSARFSYYLEKNSITHYNDATLAYLAHLINDEKSKVGFGGDPVRLKALEKDRKKYEEFIDALKKGKKTGARYQELDEEGVYNEVKKLYRMNHYGRMLHDVAQVVGRAYAASFRERPYRVRGKGYWMSDVIPKAYPRNARNHTHLAPPEKRDQQFGWTRIKSMVTSRGTGEKASRKPSVVESAPVTSHPLLDDSSPSLPPPSYETVLLEQSRSQATHSESGSWESGPAGQGSTSADSYVSAPLRWLLKSFGQRQPPRP